MAVNPYTIFDVSVLDAIEKQALLDGWIYLGLAIIALIGLGVGVYFIQSFLKSINQEKEKWILYVGVGLTAFCVLFFLIFIWMSLGRLLNPSFYAVEYLKGMLKIQRKLQLPF